MLDHVAGSGLHWVRRVALFSHAVRAHTTNEFTESLVLSWSVIESLVNEIWLVNKAAQTWSGNQNKPIRDKFGDLHSGGLLPPENLTKCNELRVLRNQIMHNLSEAPQVSSRECLAQAEYFIEHLSGLTFKVAAWAFGGVKCTYCLPGSYKPAPPRQQ